MIFVLLATAAERFALLKSRSCATTTTVYFYIFPKTTLGQFKHGFYVTVCYRCVFEHSVQSSKTHVTAAVHMSK